MGERQPRKRIPYVGEKSPVIIDELAFTENKSSGHARKILTNIENITIQLWIDKHYHDRWQHGDDTGKREGIGLETVEDLVKRSMKHLLFYSSLSKGFSFLNPDIKIDRPVRVVLQEECNGSTLNVVIEAHFININEYEITVKTAMIIDDFKLSDNQYVIELQGEGSVLKKFDRKAITEIYTI